MNPRLKQLFSVLFLLSFLATIAVYFISDRDMKLTWIAGACALVFYFLYRFSKR